jgi:hypothetical protein
MAIWLNGYPMNYGAPPGVLCVVTLRSLRLKILNLTAKVAKKAPSSLRCFKGLAYLLDFQYAIFNLNKPG